MKKILITAALLSGAVYWLKKKAKAVKVGKEKKEKKFYS